MKIDSFLIFVLLFLMSFVALTNAVPTCTFRSGSCNSGETCIFSVYQENDSHVGTCNYYNTKVCCTEINSSTFRTSCNSNEGTLLSVYQQNDTHVGSKDYYNTKVCANFSNNIATGNFKTSCSSSEACLVSTYQENDSHVGTCNYYSNKICIVEVVNVTVTVNLNDTEPSWNEPLLVSGKASRADSTNIDTNSSGVNIYVNGTSRCTTETDSNGDYSCSFNAPNSLGLYQINVTVLDPITVKTWSNTTTFTVKSVIGASRIDERDEDQISCHEEPRIIQNPDGSLKSAIIRICVWK